MGSVDGGWCEVSPKGRTEHQHAVRRGGEKRKVAEVRRMSERRVVLLRRI